MDVLKAIEERAENATPGPWTAFSVWGDGDYLNATRFGTESGKDVLRPNDSTTDIRGTRADFEFVRFSRTDVPALVRALRVALEGLDCDYIFAKPCSETSGWCIPCGYRRRVFAELPGGPCDEREEKERA